MGSEFAANIPASLLFLVFGIGLIGAVVFGFDIGNKGYTENKIKLTYVARFLFALAVVLLAAFLIAATEL